MYYEEKAGVDFTKLYKPKWRLAKYSQLNFTNKVQMLKLRQSLPKLTPGKTIVKRGLLPVKSCTLIKIKKIIF
jgi:hypothetical protein